MTATTESTIDRDLYRHTLGTFATGVVVVTGVTASGAPAGLTCQSFTSLSMDPPLVTVSPARTSTSWSAMEGSGRFAVNVLGEHQGRLSAAFARSGADKFAGVEWSWSRLGLPVVDGTLAQIECELESVVPGGDHVIAIGRVLDLRTADIEQKKAAPLVFFRSAYHRLLLHD